MALHHWETFHQLSAAGSGAHHSLGFEHDLSNKGTVGAIMSDRNRSSGVALGTVVVLITVAALVGMLVA
jgi:hypothetical protein